MKVLGTAAALVALALAGAALAAGTGGSGRSAGTVKVTLREYAIAFSPRSIAPGRVTFVVHNAGRAVHALALAGPGRTAVRTPSIRPGATRRLAVVLRKGSFRLWCPVGRHAAAGMTARLRVGAVAAVPPPATTTTSGYGYRSGGNGY